VPVQQQVVAELQQLRAELELRDQQYNAALDELEARRPAAWAAAAERRVPSGGACMWSAVPLSQTVMPAPGARPCCRAAQAEDARCRRFSFRQRRVAIDWRLVHSVDVQQLVGGAASG
jgi:Tfp pilus assembly protein FimV